jgi:putative copper export protein
MPAPLPPPPPTLAPISDGVITGTMWIALMAPVGLLALALVVTRPASTPDRPEVIARLARTATVLGLIAIPAYLLDLARGLSQDGGFALAAARASLYDGTAAGALRGLGITLAALALLLTVPLCWRRVAAGRGATWLMASGLTIGILALATTKAPSETPEAWGRELFSMLVWLLHLGGGSIWVGGLIGLAALALPGAVSPGHRRTFWSRALRSFSASAMACVAAILLSGLWLYWQHVDGPTQLLTTLYGRVLGVKILIFGTMLALGAANQFWLHPRIARLRATGDDRPLRTILMREFRVLVGIEVLLGMTVLMVAPFLHGSARGEVFAKEHPAAAAAGERAPQKEPSVSTWLYGTAETGAVITLMVAGYCVSGRLARRRTAAA